MVRWDSPLISIPWDEDPPLEEIWNIVIKGEKKGPTAAVMQVSPTPSPSNPRCFLADASCFCREQNQHRTHYIPSQVQLRQ